MEVSAANGQAAADAVRFVPAPAAASEVIIDNGQPGTTFTGSWCVSSGAGFFGPDSLYSCGTGSDTYRWTPTLTAGTFDHHLHIELAGPHIERDGTTLCRRCS